MIPMMNLRRRKRRESIMNLKRLILGDFQHWNGASVVIVQSWKKAWTVSVATKRP